MSKRAIDPDKLRAALRKMSRSDLLVVLGRALDHVPKTRLPELVDGFVSFDALVATTRKKKVSLLEKVKAFHEASLRGEYYDAFDVNSKNFMDTSEGTEEWIVECERLFKDVLDSSAEGDRGEARQAFELLFALLRRIDEGEDDVVFFADEGGSWRVSVDWPKVLPAWFRCLAATAEPEEYARLVNDMIKDFVRRDAPKYLAKARGAATREQKAALAKVSGAEGTPPRR
jgi:hypothetical protein